MDDFAEAGYAVGRWTTNAYKDVYHWSGIKDDYQSLRVLGSIFAYVGLIFPYVAAGVLYILVPFSPTTYLELDITASYHFGSDALEGFVEGGLGAVAFIHPEYDVVRGGFGPAAGAGVKLGILRIGAHTLWSPPGTHGSLGTTDEHVMTASATVGISK
jgi:hypothetical protein